jgi:pimeloyl-ACP methyl ester carboxylesterase
MQEITDFSLARATLGNSRLSGRLFGPGVLIVALLSVFLVSCSSCTRNNESATGPAGHTPGASQSPARPGDGAHYQRNEGKDRVIVFVHGVYGSAATTWTCSQGNTSWPELMVGDDTFKNSDIYVVDYPSPKIGNIMSIDEEVSNIMNRMTDAKVFDHSEVVFLVHSLGGLITQRLLLTHRELIPKVKFIYFFSTPEEGAQVARLGHVLNNDPLLQQMFHGDENTYIESIETDWIGARLDMPRYCAFERRPTKGILVVDRLSATRLCNCEPVALYADHSTIVEPCDRNDGSYIAFRNAYRENPVRSVAVEQREWKSYQQVDCERTNSNHALLASVTLNPAYLETVDGTVTARFDGIDHIQGQAIKVVSQSGNTATIDYGFNGADRSFGNCPGGGHATIVVTFPIRQQIPLQ